MRLVSDEGESQQDEQESDEVALSCHAWTRPTNATDTWLGSAGRRAQHETQGKRKEGNIPSVTGEGFL